MKIQLVLFLTLLVIGTFNIAAQEKKDLELFQMTASLYRTIDITFDSTKWEKTSYIDSLLNVIMVDSSNKKLNASISRLKSYHKEILKFNDSDWSDPNLNDLDLFLFKIIKEAYESETKPTKQNLKVFKDKIIAMRAGLKTRKLEDLTVKKDNSAKQDNVSDWLPYNTLLITLLIIMTILIAETAYLIFVGLKKKKEFPKESLSNNYQDLKLNYHNAKKEIVRLNQVIKEMELSPKQSKPEILRYVPEITNNIDVLAGTDVVKKNGNNTKSNRLENVFYSQSILDGQFSDSELSSEDDLLFKIVIKGKLALVSINPQASHIGALNDPTGRLSSICRWKVHPGHNARKICTDSEALFQFDDFSKLFVLSDMMVIHFE